MLTPLNLFYTVKLGFKGYTLFFSFMLRNIDCGYSLEMSAHNLGFEQNYKKIIQNFYLEIFIFSW